MCLAVTGEGFGTRVVCGETGAVHVSASGYIYFLNTSLGSSSFELLGF